MKKKTLVSAVLAATIMGTTSVSLAAENMFSDVPLDHWAYDAIAKLAEDGIIEGYGDTGFGGDKAITRYEMAQLVAKAQANQENARAVDKAAIEKLQQEFDSELKGEVQDLKKDVADLKSRMGWYGDARVRFFTNKFQGLTDNYTWRNGKGTTFEQRVRLGFWANPDENLSVDGRLKLENTIGKNDGWGGDRQNNWNGTLNNQGKFGIDKMTLTWKKGDTQYRIGRNEVNLGQGLLYWENPIDGVEVQHQFGDKVTAKIGYGDTSVATWADSTVWTVYGDVSVKTSPATTFTLAALHNTTDYQTANIVAWDGAPLKPTYADSNFKMNQFAIGVNTQLAPKWNLIAEGVTNNVSSQNGEDTNKNGLWTRVTYGNLVWDKANTWHVYGEYFALGNAAVDSKGWPHHLNIAGGNAGYDSWGNGTRGWGVGVGYQLARNTNLELTYYMLKPYNKTTFDNYNNVGYAALTYSF